MSDERVLHGLLQKADRDATDLKRIVRQAPDGWQLWLWRDEAWDYAGKFARKSYLESFLVAQLSQEER